VFSTIGCDKMLVLLVAALVVLGPERLPGALHECLQILRRARDYASGATEALHEDLRTALGEFRPALDDVGQVFPHSGRPPDIAPRVVFTAHGDEDEMGIASGRDPARGENIGTRARQCPAESGTGMTPVSSQALDSERNPENATFVVTRRSVGPVDRAPS